MKKIIQAIERLSAHALDIAIAVSVLALIIAVMLVAWLAATSPSAQEIQRQQDAWYRQQEQHYNQPAVKRAWRRLSIKHGHPAVIIEPGKTPYYINASGQRCPFI